MFNYLIIGSGFAGSVLAEQLAAAGKSVAIADRRNYVGGNAADEKNSHGILCHLHGPHLFHTNSERIFGYLSKFTKWRNYEHRVLASVDGALYPFPVNLDTINRVYGSKMDSDALAGFLEAAIKASGVCLPAQNAAEACIARMGVHLFKVFFQNYTRKQWGRCASLLDPSVTAKIPIRLDLEDRYFTDRFQAVPEEGYTRMFENMLGNENITRFMGTAYQDVKHVPHEKLIFTGPADEYFGHRFGPLPYRSLRFEHNTLNQDRFQPVGTVNYPNDHEFTRITEWKHITGQEHRKTTITREFPCESGDPYYPIPCKESATLYQRYKALADREKNVFFVGRLATYRYLNMDQVVGSALTLADKLT